jgi:hypothetical protein
MSLFKGRRGPPAPEHNAHLLSAEDQERDRIKRRAREAQLRDYKYRTEHWERLVLTPLSREINTCKVLAHQYKHGTHKTEVNPAAAEFWTAYTQLCRRIRKKLQLMAGAAKAPEPDANWGTYVPEAIKTKVLLTYAERVPPKPGQRRKELFGATATGPEPTVAQLRVRSAASKRLKDMQARLEERIALDGPNLPKSYLAKLRLELHCIEQARIALQNRPLFKPTPRRWEHLLSAELRAQRREATNPDGLVLKPSAPEWWEDRLRGEVPLEPESREAADEGESDGQADA